MTKQEEAQVIAEVLAGDADRFEALVREHEKSVYSHCLRMLGSEQDALDAAQETFLRAYRGLEGFRGDSRFGLWLHQLARNVCIDALRRRPSRPDAPLTDIEGEPLPIPDGGPSPQEALERKELRRLVRRGLLRLSPEFRQVLVLRDVNGLSYEEIARVTGLKEGTVKSQLFRARKKLAAILLSDGNFSELSPSFLSPEKFSEEGGAKP